MHMHTAFVYPLEAQSTLVPTLADPHHHDLFFFASGPFSLSMQLFWPIQAWRSSGLVFILDGDSPFDRQQGTVLENLAIASKIKVKYEAPAPKVCWKTAARLPDAPDCWLLWLIVCGVFLSVFRKGAVRWDIQHGYHTVGFRYADVTRRRGGRAPILTILISERPRQYLSP